MTVENVYRGACFCGAVQLELRGAPEVQGYCHCGSCRSWSAGPVNGFTLWKPSALRITAGADHLARFNKTALSTRTFCRACGGHLYTEHGPWELVDVYAATIPEFAFQPGVHVHYQETVLPMRDGLPKFKDIPSEMGGSGQVLAE